VFVVVPLVPALANAATAMAVVVSIIAAWFLRKRTDGPPAAPRSIGH
jgi:hypothetical protein